MYHHNVNLPQDALPSLICGTLVQHSMADGVLSIGVTGCVTVTNVAYPDGANDSTSETTIVRDSGRAVNPLALKNEALGFKPSLVQKSMIPASALGFN